jgi:hypothetical protein
LQGIGLLMAIIAMLGGCKKDSNDEARNNAISYDNKEYALLDGYIEYYGKIPGKQSYNLDLTLLSSGFTLHEENGVIDSVSGTGNILYLEVFTADTVFDSKPYTFDPEETHEAGTFDRAAVGLNLNVLTYEGEFLTITSGSFKINKKTDLYEVTLNCRNANGKAITAYFNGTMKYYNYEDVILKKTAEIPSFFKRTF